MDKEEETASIQARMGKKVWPQAFFILTFRLISLWVFFFLPREILHIFFISPEEPSLDPPSS